MKAQIRQMEQTGFKPVQLIVDLESEDELRSLYHRMYLSNREVAAISGAIGEPLPNQSVDDGLSGIIFTEVSEFLKGLK